MNRKAAVICALCTPDGDAMWCSCNGGRIGNWKLTGHTATLLYLLNVMSCRGLYVATSLRTGRGCGGRTRGRDWTKGGDIRGQMIYLGQLQRGCGCLGTIDDERDGISVCKIPR